MIHLIIYKWGPINKICLKISKLNLFLRLDSIDSEIRLILIVLLDLIDLKEFIVNSKLSKALNKNLYFVGSGNFFY